jgi:DNA-binding transcriptional ArsR family regulator
MNYIINKDQVAILTEIMDSERSLTELAKILGRSKSHTSENVKHLVDLGLVRSERKGVSIRIGKSESDLARGLYLLLMENPHIDFSSVLTGSGLKILPWLTGDGLTKTDLVKRSGLSPRTLERFFVRMTSMGILISKNGRWKLNPRYPLLARFLDDLWKKKNADLLRNKAHEGVIIWQRKEEFLCSVKRYLNDPDLVAAAVTRLEELGYGLVSINRYYFHSAPSRKINLEEAMVQSYLVTDGDQRIKRIFIDAKERIKLTEIKRFERIYDTELVV